MDRKKRRRYGRRLIALLLSASMLMEGNVAMAAAAVGNEKAEETAAKEKLKDAIRDSDAMVKEYPHGLFNFLATQYETGEGEDYLEIAVIRQGGAEGEASVRFRAIDVTSSYGDDYEIYTSKTKKKSTMIQKGEDAAPLIESAYNKETDLGETAEAADGETLVKDAVEQNAQQQSTPDPAAGAEDKSASAAKSGSGNASAVETVSLKDSDASTLKDAVSGESGVESDRKDWRVVAEGSGEETAVREQYDAFLSKVGGSETTLTFADGEYVRYLYLFPEDDGVPESEEQLLMALLKTDDKAPVGGSYSAYVNIKDNDEKEKVAYEFAKEEVSAGKGKVSVTVRRTSGAGYYDSVYVGTGEGTANAGADYEAGLKKLDFFAGQTEQKVTVKILDNEYRDADRDFYLLLSRDGEEYEESGCHVTIAAGGKASARSVGTGSGNALTAGTEAEKISENGAHYGNAGRWQLVPADFTGIFDTDTNWLKTRGAGTYEYEGATICCDGNTSVLRAKAAGVSLYGVDSIDFLVSAQNYGSWTSYYDYQAVDSYFTNQTPNRGIESKSVNITDWNADMALCADGHGVNGSVTVNMDGPTLYLHKYNYSISPSKDQFYKKTYTLDDTGDGTLKETGGESITPTLKLSKVGSTIGNATDSPSGDTYLYRSDALTFTMEGYDPGALVCKGIEASADGTNFVKVSDGLNVVMNTEFFKRFNDGASNKLQNSDRIYFRPIVEQSNATVEFTLENSSKGTYTNISEGKKITLHYGDEIRNIRGMSGKVASYQPSFAYRTGSDEASAKSIGFSAAGDGALTLDPGNSQGAVANYTVGSSYTEIRLSYTNPSMTLQADPNTYRNTFANEVITVDGTEYECDSREAVDKLHDAMEEKYENNTDANVKLSFEYCFNTIYMNGTLTEDPDFKTPQSATLRIYTDDGAAADKTETVKPTTSTRDGKTIYTFAFEGSWKDKGWVDGSTATVTLNGENGMTSQETEIDFLSTSASGVFAYDAAKVATAEDLEDNVLAAEDGRTIGTIRNLLTYKNMNPLLTYSFAAMTSSRFITRWGDYSMDTNNDGNISNEGDDNEVAAAQKRLEELGQDTSLALKNSEIYFGNNFAYSPSVFAQSKVYYDFVTRDTSTGSGNRLGLNLTEEKATAIKPGTYITSPLKGATVTVLGTEVMDEGDSGNYYIQGAYEKGVNYLADVVYQGIHFQARCVGTRTQNETIRTSDLMFPTDFSVLEDGKATGVGTDGSSSYLDVHTESGVYHTFAFNFRSTVGVQANKAKVTFYDKDGKTLYTATQERASTSDPFAFKVDLAAAGVKPGANMTIQGIYNDGDADYVYPEVETGILFKRELTELGVVGSFNTAFDKRLKMFGKVSTSFDLPKDFVLSSVQPVEYTDNDGAKHQVQQIVFGYNTTVNDDLEKLQTAQMAKNNGNAMSGRGVVNKYLEGVMKNGVKATNDSADTGTATVEAMQDPAATKKDDLGNTSFDYGFSVALILTVETGPSTDPETGGDTYFDSLMFVAAGSAGMKGSVCYTTPIGIDIMLSMSAGGTAAAAFAAEASAEDPYNDAYSLTKETTDGIYPIGNDDLDMYTKFLVAPKIEVEAGAGIAGGKIAKASVSGEAAFNFQFSEPVMGASTSSSGSGTVTLGAYLQLKILFVKKKWTLYKNEKMNLFNYSTQSVGAMFSDFEEDYLYDAVDGEELETVSRDYLKSGSEWQPYRKTLQKVQAGSENVLKKGVYPYPDAKLLDLSDGKLLAVFLDDPGKSKKDANNSATVAWSYSSDDGATWTEPKSVDNDRTGDESPYVYQVTDKKALILWSDASALLKNASGGDALQDNLASLDISGAWFDVDTAAVGKPFTVVRTKVSDRKNFQEAAPMVSYDEEANKLLVYYTVTDYEEETQAGADAAAEDAVTYGDIINAYSAIGVVTATMKDDGTFSSFSEPELLELGVPFTAEEAADGTRTLTGEAITDPKVVDSDVASCGGLSLHAYTVDKDQSDATLEDRELFVQVYDFDRDEFQYPIQITCDGVEDACPRFVECRQLTYLYWVSDGDVQYMNITALINDMNAGRKYLRLTSVDNTLTEKQGDRANVYLLNGADELIGTAVAYERSTDAEGNEDGQKVSSFDVRANGENMYMLWTEPVAEQREDAAKGESDVIRETQIFGAYYGVDAGGWSEPIQITRKTGDDYNYSDVSFRVTEDDEIQAIFSRGKMVRNEETGAYSMDEAGRLLAVQTFKVENTVEKGEMAYEPVTYGNNSTENDGASYCYPGDVVEWSADVTNDGFKELSNASYRTYLTKGGEMVEKSASDWKAVDPYGAVAASSRSGGFPAFRGGRTVTLSGRSALGDDVSGTGFVIEMRYTDEDGKEQTEKITEDLLVEPNVVVTAEQTRIAGKDKAAVTVGVSNSGNEAYTGDLKLAYGKKELETLEDVTIGAGETASYTIEADISGCTFGKLTTNKDGSKQDALSLKLAYGDEAEATATIVRQTSVDEGRAADAIKSVDIVASDATDQDAKTTKVGTSYSAPLDSAVTLEAVFNVNKTGAAAKALAADGCTADAQMVTEWSSSDPGVAYVSDKGLLVPMKKGTAKITATIYPGQRTQSGTAECVSGTSGGGKDFGTVTSKAGTGAYTTANGQYLVPEGLITKKTFTVKVGAAATPSKPTTTKAWKGSLQYKVTTGKSTAAVVSAKKNQKTLTVPATVKIGNKTYKVTSIAAGALKGQTKLTKVSIGKNVTAIGSKAFYNDKKLKTVIFKGSKAPSIGSKAFTGIYKKAVYDVPNSRKKAYAKKLTKKAGYVKTQKIK